MDDHLKQVYARLLERYEQGDVPWDDPLPPPEVTQFVPTLEPGRALDLGCGYGRASLYLAAQGWDVDGVDFVEEALDEARRRSKKAGLSIKFHRASVTELDFLQGSYQFALDVGCGHALDYRGLELYRDHLSRLMAPGGIFLLFARLASDDDGEADEAPGLDESKLLELFSRDFTLDWIQHGHTEMADDSSWDSAWYRFRRT